MATIDNILAKDEFTKENIIYLLSTQGEEKNMLFEKSAAVKSATVGNKVYYRGLIELSNACAKDCLYCGIRKSNAKVERYNLSDSDVLAAAQFAYENRYGSLAIQSGELKSPAFRRRITNLLKQIKELSNGELGITISLGEQDEETYQEWFDAGAHRYLLRIEVSNPALYHKYHPADHSYEERLQCLKTLHKIGYQVGTGVMVGLPFQTLADLADDLLFMKAMDVHMVGMGPYVEHKDTPLYEFRSQLLPQEERFTLTLKMIAILRLMMPDINMVAATAMQAIDPLGREKALKVGANILMPNITPGQHRDDYKLYENKPCTDDAAEDCKNCLEARIHIAGQEVGYGEWGDSKRFHPKKRD